MRLISDCAVKARDIPKDKRDYLMQFFKVYLAGHKHRPDQFEGRHIWYITALEDEPGAEMMWAESVWFMRGSPQWVTTRIPRTVEEIEAWAREFPARYPVPEIRWGYPV